VLLALDENDPLVMASLSGFKRKLVDSGWTVDRNLQINYRGPVSDDERAQVAAAKHPRAINHPPKTMLVVPG
jgi:hypothetical protein